MNWLIFLSVWMLTTASPAEAWRCRAGRVDLLVIGDSQTGTPDHKSYFGNYLQRCLQEKKVSFVTYGRGSTRPEHWLDNDEKDQVTTIMRNSFHEEVNLGWGAMVPLCQKRLDPMIEAHRPEKVMAFFGDNFILHSREEITKQSRALVKVIRDRGITFQNCYFLTATYEMEVPSNPRNPDKNYQNTLDVDIAIRDAVGSECQVIDGLALMKNSPLLSDQASGFKLKRVQTDGESDCFGKSENDNVHYCGEAAREFATQVCEKLTSRF